MAIPHSLFLVNESATTDAERLTAWHGDLASATVGDLHVWMANQRKLRSFNLLVCRFSTSTHLTPVFQGSWSQTLTAAGVVGGTILFVSDSKEQLPCDAYALATFVAPTTQFELQSPHSLQATIFDDAMVVWAPATIKAAAERIRARDGVFTWRARVTRMLAQHVTAIREGSTGAFASLKAIKALLKLWSVLGVPSDDAVEAAHALTVLLSSSQADMGVVRHTTLRAFDAGAAIPALAQAVAAADTDNATVAAALAQLAAVVARTTKGGADAPGFRFAVPADAYPALGILFTKPFAVAAGIKWRVPAQQTGNAGAGAGMGELLEGLEVGLQLKLLAALFAAGTHRR